MHENIRSEDKQKIISLLSALFPQATIILFGSRARGTHATTSDIDLALDAGRKIEQWHSIGEAREVVSGLYLPYKIDIVDLHAVSPEMRELIEKEGIVWKKP